jgi:hypothetical protein
MWDSSFQVRSLAQFYICPTDIFCKIDFLIQSVHSYELWFLAHFVSKDTTRLKNFLLEKFDNLHRKKYISCAGKLEDSYYLAKLAQWLFARWANIFASMANIFAGTGQYLQAWLNISRHSSIFASMANTLAGTAQYMPAWLIY